MSDDKDEYEITTSSDTDDIISIPYVDVHDGVGQFNTHPHVTYPPLVIDQMDEIKALKKEIQELKDMIAEHILLGHE